MPARRPMHHSLATRAAIQTDRPSKSPARVYISFMSCHGLWACTMPFMCASVERQPAEMSDEGDDEDCQMSGRQLIICNILPPPCDRKGVCAHIFGKMCIFSPSQGDGKSKCIPQRLTSLPPRPCRAIYHLNRRTSLTPIPTDYGHQSSYGRQSAIIHR